MEIEIAKKLRRSLRDIDGSLNEKVALLFAFLDEIHQRNDIHGGCFEIGVFHGQTSVFLANLLRAKTETLGICDIFENQHLNVSKSGPGSRERFMSNFNRHFSDSSILKVHAKASSSLTATEIGKGIRLFHVDGGHNFEEALEDLELAASTLHPLGCIVLDDTFRADWPGVSEALIRFLDRHADYSAIIAGFNKVVIVPQSAIGIYLRDGDHLLESYFKGNAYLEKFESKRTKLCGKDLISITCTVRSDIRPSWPRKTLGLVLDPIEASLRRIQGRPL